MNTPLELNDAGKRLLKVDMLLMALLKKRMDLALEVGKRKALESDKNKQKIFNPGRESQRLRGVRKWARDHGINPHFSESVLYPIIGESCKQQMIQFQNRRGDPSEEKTAVKNTRLWNKMLDRNLLTLTKHWSETYDDSYDKAYFATQDYVEFESTIIVSEINRLSDREKMIDVGCATGRLTFQLGKYFKQLSGYDISPHMIRRAEARSVAGGIEHIHFDTLDIQKGIPHHDNSVSFVVMNLGTASDIRNINTVLKEIKRVLKPQGRFFLSFYNKEALLYQFDFIPWPTGLAAEINTIKQCLDVHVGKKITPVYAKAYTVDEVLELIKGGLSVTQVQTYPTLSAMLPHDFFENQPKLKKAITATDHELATSNWGAYIVVTGKKTK